MDTKDAIKRQFMKEYAKKSFSSISVKGLCASTPVARTTFYTYFNNMDEVLESVENEILDGLRMMTDSISKGNLSDMDFSQYMDAVELYIKDHWDIIYAFLVVQPNSRFIRKWKDAIQLNFQRRYPDKRNIANYDVISELIASSIITIYTYWMEHPDRGTDQMKPLIQDLLNSLIAII